MLMASASAQPIGTLSQMPVPPQRRSREQICWMKRPMERVMKNEAPGTTE